MTASMILPNKDLGQAFWKKSYKPKSTLKGQAFLKRTSTNLSGGVESQDARGLTASARHADSACKHVELAKDGVTCSALVSPDNASGSSAPPAQNFRRTRLKRVSDKMRKKLVEYARVKRIWWAARLEIDGGRCQFVQLDDLRCLSTASPCPHHRAGRGKNLSVPGTFLAVCVHHHDWIETHKNQARAMGLITY